jgi:hypothetical protein
VMSGSVGGGSVANVGATAPSRLFYCNGRLISLITNVAAELVAAGTATAIHTHDNTGFVWNFAVGAPNGIYLAGNGGDRGEIYYVGTDSDGTLSAAVSALSLPKGETINCMEVYGGLMILGTSVGIRLASITDAGFLNYGPVVEIGNVRCLETQGRFVWFGWSQFDATSTGLGRADLSVFTEPLVPAYASDLMATGTGNVLAVASFGNRRYFAVSGDGFFGETTTKEASGTITSGWVRYGTSERKNVSTIDIRHDVLPTGSSVTPSVLSDAEVTETAAASDVTSSLGPTTAFTIGDFNAEMFRVTVVMARATDTTLGPTLRRWTTRAIAMPYRTDEIIVPLIFSNTVDDENGDGGDKFLDVYQEWLYLKGLESARSIVQYQEGSASYSVYVDGVEVQPKDYTDDFGWYQGLVIVRLLTLETV